MKFICTLILLVSFQFSQACDCLWQGPFLEVAKNSNTVILGKVTGYDVFVKDRNGDLYPTVMEIEVQEIILPISNNSRIYSDTTKYSDEIWWAKIFNGDNIKKIRIQGHYGCKPSINKFPIDSSFLFALDMKERSIYSYDLDFSISNCGTYWLPFNNSIIKGNIKDSKKQNLSSDENIQEMELEKLIIELKKLRN